MYETRTTGDIHSRPKLIAVGAPHLFYLTQVSVVLHGSACGLKMIRKLNKKIIKRLRHPGSSYNFLNKFLYNFERSDLEANGIKSLRNLNSLIME